MNIGEVMNTLRKEMNDVCNLQTPMTKQWITELTLGERPAANQWPAPG